MKIVTEADTTGYAPRDCRYSAIDADTYDGAPDSRTRATVGYGPTPAAAIADLMALLADDIRYDTDWLREKGDAMTRPDGLAWHLFRRFHGRRRYWLPLHARLWRNRKGRDRRWPAIGGKL